MDMIEGQQPADAEQLDTLEEVRSSRSSSIKVVLAVAAGVVVLGFVSCGGVAYYTRSLLGPRKSEILARGVPVKAVQIEGTFGGITDQDLESKEGSPYPAGEILVIPPDNEVFIHCEEAGSMHHVGTKDETGVSSGSEIEVSVFCYREKIRDGHWRRVIIDWLRKCFPFFFPAIPAAPPTF